MTAAHYYIGLDMGSQVQDKYQYRFLGPEPGPEDAPLTELATPSWHLGPLGIWVGLRKPRIPFSLGGPASVQPPTVRNDQVPTASTFTSAPVGSFARGRGVDVAFSLSTYPPLRPLQPFPPRTSTSP